MFGRGGGNLVGCFEFLEETGVVLGEHTEVGDAVLQVGDALDAHTEGIAGVLLGIDAAELERFLFDPLRRQRIQSNKKEPSPGV